MTGQATLGSPKATIFLTSKSRRGVSTMSTAATTGEQSPALSLKKNLRSRLPRNPHSVLTLNVAESLYLDLLLVHI